MEINIDKPIYREEIQSNGIVYVLFLQKVGNIQTVPLVCLRVTIIENLMSLLFTLSRKYGLCLGFLHTIRQTQYSLNRFADSDLSNADTN